MQLPELKKKSEIKRYIKNLSNLPTAERNSCVKELDGEVSSLNAKLSKRFLMTFSKSIFLKIQKSQLKFHPI